MKDQTKIIAALLIGAAAGAALGLLLAPEKGEKIREGIADYIDDMVESAKTKAQITKDELKHFGASVVEQAKSKIKETVDQATDQLNEVKSKGKSAVYDVNHVVQKA